MAARAARRRRSCGAAGALRNGEKEAQASAHGCKYLRLLTLDGGGGGGGGGGGDVVSNGQCSSALSVVSAFSESALFAAGERAGTQLPL